MSVLLSILGVFLVFGCFCLSGGGSLLPFYIDELIDARHWLTLDELGNLMAISQVTPGPIGVNLATFIGFRQGGGIGGLLATVGLLAPSFVLMTLAVKSYTKWQRSDFVRGLMYSVKPMAMALVAAALLVNFGMSIFTARIPFERWLGLPGGVAEPFALRPEMLPILLFSVVALGKKKLSILSVIFISAGLGALTALLPPLF